MQSKHFFLSIALRLSGAAPVSAQQSVAYATAGRDSVLAQAALIQAEADGRVQSLSSTFVGVQGLRQTTSCYSSFLGKGRLLVKRHTIKRKTTGWLVEKRHYYDGSGWRRLEEEYHNGPLARLRLLDYLPSYFTN